MGRLARAFLATLIACSMTPSASYAGPIQWSYSVEGGGEKDGFHLDASPGEFQVETAPGERVRVHLYDGWGPQEPAFVQDVGPIFVRLNVTDLASGQSGHWDVPFFFGTNEGVDVPKPSMGDFDDTPLALGGNVYSVIGDAWDSVRVEAAPANTPEPSTVLLACLGMAGLAGARFTRRRLCQGASKAARYGDEVPKVYPMLK
jgi:PEP-CTERM motif